jgi:hypothetical protein
MSSDFGMESMRQTDRTVTVTLDKHFKSWWDLQARDAVISSELRIQLGATSGNIICINIPKFYRNEVSLEGGDKLMTNGVTGRAALNTSGDDEFFITHL